MIETHLAIDFGGGSGRVIAGFLSEGVLKLETVYRFKNRQIKIGKHIYWDFLSLFEDMKYGISMAIKKGYYIKSIGIDTWGVDFGLIDRNGNLIGNPVCYRDNRTEGLSDLFFKDYSISEYYSEVGIQVMDINTVFQLYAMKKDKDEQIEIADKLLFTPDLFCYFLTGTVSNEYSIASTSGLLNAGEKSWNRKLIQKLGIKEELFGDIVMPGASKGFIKEEIKKEFGIDYDIEVIAVASHDTASAIYAIPQANDNEIKAFLSSGTWSLLGILTNEPILTEEARLSGFTNEGGADGKICFLQNITGLWLIQKLIQQWEKEGKETAFEILIPAAERTEIRSEIDVDDEMFLSPANMEHAIDEYCKQHGLQIPQSQGEYVRCVIQSLASRYKNGIEKLNTLLPHPVTQLHIMGGGCQNTLLNKLTEEKLGIEVTTGPVEATAIGNVMMQMKAYQKH